MEISSKFDHFNFNVIDLEKSLEFYEKALGLVEKRRKVAEDGSFILVYLTDGKTDFSLELTWLRDFNRPYNLGDCEFHLCMRLDGNYDENRRYHKEMGCVCFENQQMGLYFISDPDGYWIEVLPVR